MANTIEARLVGDMKTAMKAGEKDRVQVLRMLIAALREAQLKHDSDEMASDEEIAVLRKQVKMRRESVEQAQANGREDIAQRELAEIEIVDAYLPQMMAPDEVAEKVAALAAEIDFEGPKDIGRFMKEWMARYKGLAEGRDVQSAVRGLS